MDRIRWMIARWRRRRDAARLITAPAITAQQWQMYLMNQHSRERRDHQQYGING